jgi:hypothetical protein
MINPFRLCVVLLVAGMAPAMATAQPLTHPLEVFGTLGVGQVYLDTTAPDHSAAGGGVRLRFSRQFAVQGDLLSVRWNDSVRREEAQRGHEYTRVASFTFVGIDSAPSRRVRLYWLAGVSAPLDGIVAPPPMPTVGLGARIALGDRFFLAPEIRALAMSLYRVSVSGGIALWEW